MELCITPPTTIKHPHIILATNHFTLLRSKPSLSPNHHPHLSFSARLRLRLPSHSSVCFSRLVPRVSAFDESPRDVKVVIEESPPVENNVYGEAEVVAEEVSKEGLGDDGFTGNQQVNDFFADLNIKFDSENTYSLVLYGGGALLALWLVSAIVGAIDSIPLFPKLMEVVGLGYTFWFATRYLLFKENREELAAKVEELKQEIFGSDDD